MARQANASYEGNGQRRSLSAEEALKKITQLEGQLTSIQTEIDSLKLSFANTNNRLNHLETRIVSSWVTIGTRIENIYVGYGHTILLGDAAGFVLMMYTTSLRVLQIYGDPTVESEANIQRTGNNTISFTAATGFNYVTMLSLRQN